MPRSATSAEATIADAPADIVISDRRVLAEGFRPYERIVFTSADERDTPQIRDVLRAGRRSRSCPSIPRATRSCCSGSFAGSASP